MFCWLAVCTFYFIRGDTKPLNCKTLKPGKHIVGKVTNEEPNSKCFIKMVKCSCCYKGQETGGDHKSHKNRKNT